MSQPIAWTDSPSTSSPLSATNLNRATKRALFNVKDQPYNAAGNGVADDTTAIQNAINAANTAGGGRVYLPAGVYLLS
jgi:polygalacturonase